MMSTPTTLCVTAQGCRRVTLIQGSMRYPLPSLTLQAQTCKNFPNLNQDFIGISLYSLLPWIPRASAFSLNVDLAHN